MINIAFNLNLLISQRKKYKLCKITGIRILILKA